MATSHGSVKFWLSDISDKQPTSVCKSTVVPQQCSGNRHAMRQRQQARGLHLVVETFNCIWSEHDQHHSDSLYWRLHILIYLSRHCGCYRVHVPSPTYMTEPAVTKPTLPSYRVCQEGQVCHCQLDVLRCSTQMLLSKGNQFQGIPAEDALPERAKSSTAICSMAHCILAQFDRLQMPRTASTVRQYMCCW